MLLQSLDVVRYSHIVMLHRLRLWLLVLAALLNSGGMGYWVCHDQVRSGSFWLKVCSEDISAPWSVSSPTPTDGCLRLDVRACDCHFVSIDAPRPNASSYEATIVWGDAPLLAAPLLCPHAAVRQACVPYSLAPPPQNPHTEAPTFRAPPVS